MLCGLFLFVQTRHFCPWNGRGKCLKLKRGRCAMNETQKSQITALRKKGCGYIRIANELELSENTVKSYCRRHGLSVETLQNMAFCRNCGRPITNKEKQKPRKFCSDLCRTAWWKAHPDEVSRKAIYAFVCACCGKKFAAYGNKSRKYCCHECYINFRFGGKHDGN